MKETIFKGQEGIDPLVRAKFSTGEKTVTRVPSDAQGPRTDVRLDSVLLNKDERGKMPHTKDKYLVKENPALVQWERTTREFLRELSPEHGHRVSAVMVFEWATGITIKQHMDEGGATTDLKNINKVLRFYFGQPYMTYICGRKVPRAYRVKPGYYITRHRPMTLTLWAEYTEGVLRP